MAQSFNRAIEETHQLDTEALREFKAVIKSSESYLKSIDATEELKVESIPEQYLTVKVPNLKHINFERPTVHDANILRNIIVGISHQLTSQTASQQELELLRQQLDESNKSRCELHETVEETVEGMTKNRADVLAQCKRLEDERADVVKEFDSIKSTAFKLEKQLEGSEAENVKLRRDLLELQVRQVASSELQARYVGVQQELKDTQRALRALQVERDSERKELEKLKEALDHERLRLVTEKTSLNRSLANKSGDVDRLTEENMKLRSDLLNFKLEHRGSDFESKAKAVEEMLKQSFLARDALRTELEELTNYSKELTSQLASLEQKNKAETVTLMKTVDSLREQLAVEKQIAKQLHLKVSEQEAHITALEEIACVQEDFASLREDLLQQVSMNRLVKHEALDELDALADHSIVQAQRNKAQSELLSQAAEFVQDQSAELEEVKYRLYIAKNQDFVYKPVKGDLLDEALASYLTERPEKVAVPFIRESKEIYTFGAKRVFVRLDQGKISVRVGGGFMPIEDFLAVYSKAELEKFEAKTAQRSPSNIGKIIGKLSQSASMSPRKAAQIISGTMEKFADYTTCYGFSRTGSRKVTLQAKPVADDAS